MKEDDEKRPNGRDLSGMLWVDGKYVPRFLPSDGEWECLTMSTPGAWTAAGIRAALDKEQSHKAFLHLCNTFAEHHAACFAGGLPECDEWGLPCEGNAKPANATQAEAVRLVEQLRFETFAALADFLNLLGAAGPPK